MLSPFLDRVTDRERGTISPERVCEALRMPMARLAGLAHVHRNTLARRPESLLVGKVRRTGVGRARPARWPADEPDVLAGGLTPRQPDEVAPCGQVPYYLTSYSD
jgi:hypothetical protein